MKLQEELEEKDMDKAMIQAMVDREREIEEAEMQERLRIRQEAVDMVQNATLRNNQNEDLERQIEAYAAKQHAEQLAKMDEEWRKREEARIKLMEEVYNSRAGAVSDKRSQAERMAQLAQLEKEQLEAQVRREELLDQQRRNIAAMNKKEHQQDLRFQISDKERIGARSQQEDMYERRAAQLAEIKYKRMIEEEKRNGLQRVEQIRAQRPFWPWLKVILIITFSLKIKNDGRPARLVREVDFRHRREAAHWDFFNEER